MTLITNNDISLFLNRLFWKDVSPNISFAIISFKDFSIYFNNEFGTFYQGSEIYHLEPFSKNLVKIISY